MRGSYKVYNANKGEGVNLPLNYKGDGLQLKIENNHLGSSYDGEKNGEDVGEVGANVDPMYIHCTHKDLVNLRDSSKLIPGTFYRIVDYITTTSQSNTESAGHQFDIIVQALDDHTLSENAQAIQHEGDTYFANSNLAAWKLWYTLDNDKQKYTWAGENEQPHTWKCSSGILGTVNSADGTLEYETVGIDGTTYYLYTPENPTYYSSESFVRIGVETVTSTKDFTYIPTGDPNYGGNGDSGYDSGDCDSGYDSGDCDCDSDYDCDYTPDVSYSSIDVYYNTTKIATFHKFEELWYDEYDNDQTYGIEFDENYNPISGIEEWWNNVKGGSIDISGYIPFKGDFNKIKLAFTSSLTYGTSSVYYIYSEEDKNLYFIDNRDNDCGDSDCGDSDDCVEGEKPLQSFDEVFYEFVAYEDSGKGVIYRMIDEFGNDIPGDFKNIKFDDGKRNYSYVFGKYGSNTDNSIQQSSKCENNVVQVVSSSGRSLQEICFEDVMINNNIVISSRISRVHFANRVRESNFIIDSGDITISSDSGNGIYASNFNLDGDCTIKCELQKCNIRMSDSSLFAKNLLYSNVCLHGKSLYGTDFTFRKNNTSQTPEVFNHVNLDITSNSTGVAFLTTSSTTGGGIFGALTAIDIKLSNASGNIDISSIGTGRNFWTHVGQNSSGEIKIGCPADLIP